MRMFDTDRFSRLKAWLAASVTSGANLFTKRVRPVRRLVCVALTVKDIVCENSFVLL